MMGKGIYINDKYLSFADAQAYFKGELAKRENSPDYFLSFFAYLPDPDPVLRKQNADIRIYKDLVSDAKVTAVIDQRNDGVLELEWDINRGRASTKETEIIKQTFNNFDLHSVIEEMLTAYWYGMKPTEVIWDVVNGLILPVRLVGKPIEWFTFDAKTNGLRLKTSADWISGVPVNEDTSYPKKFLLPRYKATYENPYGEPLASRCFWPVTFKRSGWKFWITFAEKYGTPFAVGKLPRTQEKKAYDELTKMLATMVQDAVATIPNDSSVEIIEAAGKQASSNIHQAIIDAANNEIALAVLSETLTTEAPKTGGTRAATTEHGAQLTKKHGSDKRMIEQAMNQLIGWIYDLNFPNAERAKFTLYEEDDVDQKLADRDGILTSRVGVKFSKKYIQQAYNLEDDDFEMGAPTGQQSPIGFSEDYEEIVAKAEQLAVEHVNDFYTPVELQKQLDPAIEPVVKMVQDKKQYSEIIDGLTKVYGKMNTKQLEKKLARAIFLAKVWGRINAND